MLLWCSSCHGVLVNEVGEVLLLQVEKRGLFGKCFLPSWKVLNRPQDALNLAGHLHNRHCKGGINQRPKLGPRRASGGVGTPRVRLHPNWAQMSPGLAGGLL
jgi:hypothetical protein